MLVNQFNELSNYLEDAHGYRLDRLAPRAAVAHGLLTSYSDPTQSVILLLSKTDPQSLADARQWLVDIGKIVDTAQLGSPAGGSYITWAACRR